MCGHCRLADFFYSVDLLCFCKKEGPLFNLNECMKLMFCATAALQEIVVESWRFMLILHISFSGSISTIIVLPFAFKVNSKPNLINGLITAGDCIFMISLCLCFLCRWKACISSILFLLFFIMIDQSQKPLVVRAEFSVV